MTNSIETARKWIKNADAILVTASNGFSISEGLNLFANDQKLTDVVGQELMGKYHFQNLLAALSFDYPNAMDRWKAYARITEYYANSYKPGKLMDSLKKIIDDKPYFIWTSNVDHHFKLAGFDNTLEIEGNWLEGVCSAHPDEHGTTDLKEILHQIYIKDQDGTLTEDDLPTCDQCGAPLTLNLAGEQFQIDQAKVDKFAKFVQTYQSQKLLVLELGIGPQNQMIKAPSMQLVAGNKASHYLTINKGQLYIPNTIADRAIGFSSAIDNAFQELITGDDLGIKTTGPAKPQPELTPEQREEQEKAIQPYYPSYMIDRGVRPGELTMYMTVDPKHLSHLHMVQHGQSWMYSLGDAAIAHCFTQNGQYYKVTLGLDKTKGQVHGFYVDPGTFVAFEDANDSGAGFSQISGSIPSSSDGRIMIPKRSELLKIFPRQADLINRLSAEEE